MSDKEKYEIIEFEERVTNFYFYNDVLRKLFDFYKENKSEAPIFSFEKVEWIDAMVIPNLLRLGMTLRNFHNEPIKLKLTYNVRLLYFLHHIGFFMYAGRLGLDIFEYEESLIGGFDMLMNQKQYREKHKVHFYKNLNGYYNINENTERVRMRTLLFEQLRYFVIPDDFKEIISDQGSIEDNEINEYLNIFTEIVANAMLYSESSSFCFLQTDKYKTAISVVDNGIGFYKSLSRKNHEFVLLNEFKMSSNYNKRLEDLYIIFDTLKHSQEQNRENLWRLKEKIALNEGTLRIHYNSTQVIFSGNNCHGCIANVQKCLKCVIENFRKEQKLSPLRLFDVGYKGVHIEIELSRRGQK